MTDNIIFIDLDYFPPSTDRLFRLPAVIREKGAASIYLKMLCNFPWEFEPRMRADSFYPENVTAHFIKLCSEAGISLSFLFPAPDDFGRLLRLPGYNRMAAADSDLLTLDPGSTGIKSFFESIIEDVVSLVPDIESFVLRSSEGGKAGSDRITLYNNLVGACASECGFGVALLPEGISSLYAEQVFALTEGDLGLPAVIENLRKSLEDFGNSVFEIKQFTVMSSLFCNAPAASGENHFDLFRSLEKKKETLLQSLDFLKKEGSPVIDSCWLGRYLSSIKIAAEEDFQNSAVRLRQLGLLRDT